MQIKEGVVMAGLRIEMRPALIFADQIWREHGQELVITGALDGTHSAGSLHYYGYALDLRTRFFTAAQVKIVAAELKHKLGTNYDVIIEGDHIHVEYDDKSRGY